MENRTQLLPGVYLTAVQTNKFKTGCMSINFLRPLEKKTAAVNALIPSVLLRGSQSYPDMRSISIFLDELYGASAGTLVRKKGEVQSTGFFLDFIEDAFALNQEPILAPVIAFLGDILLRPLVKDGAFSAAYVEGEKANLCNTIEAQVNDKRSFAMAQMLKAMCKKEAYGVPRLGDAEDVASITPASLYDSYRQLLEHSQVEIFYMGRQPGDKVARLLQVALQDLPRGSIDPVGTQVVRRAEAVQEIEQVMDVTQGKLTMGLRTGITAQDRLYPALMVLNTVFGSGVTSKLFVHVREEKSLCYYANSSIEKFKGVMAISSGIEFGAYQVAKDAILQQLEACKQADITQEELEAAKQQLCSSLRIGMDSPGRLDDFYMGQTIAGLSGTMEQLARQIEAVSLEQLVQAASGITLDTVYFLKGETI